MRRILEKERSRQLSASLASAAQGDRTRAGTAADANRMSESAWCRTRRARIVGAWLPPIESSMVPRLTLSSPVNAGLDYFLALCCTVLVIIALQFSSAGPFVTQDVGWPKLDSAPSPRFKWDLGGLP